MNNQEALTAYTAAFVNELVLTGVCDVVVSPGSRSTPMAMMMAEHPNMKVHILVDERSAGFFALGMAKSIKRPVALLCTSGTAGANYYPAVIEASYSRIPLIVLTADRPHELREVGAPQAIDQLHLYGHHVKAFYEMPIPEKEKSVIRHARMTCARAVSTACTHPLGPVHLNFPFREPLIPQLDNEDLFKNEERNEKYVQIETGNWTLNHSQFEALATKLVENRNGIIICGLMDEEGFEEGIIDLAAKLNFPILADPLSQLRSGEHDGQLIVDCYDNFLRNEYARNYLKPEIVLRFGAMPVSKALSNFLKENHNAIHIVVDGGSGWRDPSALATEMVFCDERLFCESVSNLVPDELVNSNCSKWTAINEIAKERMLAVKDLKDMDEGKLFSLLADIIPSNSTLFVGNSMPIRDLDSFFYFNNKSIKVMANRGANGIDGIVSSALGAAVYSKPLYLILGDLTFYHDLNGLLASKILNIDITIIIINNNGGGIFSFLPQVNHPKNFELLFGTPLDIDFQHVVKMYGGTYAKTENWDEFHSYWSHIKREKGLKVIEVPTNREKNVIEHRNLWNSVSREIENYIAGQE
ncbi:2-succinyl-5-enolpyruvyl-6-hydroxy-3-cyclohexene-1-carboxylic-acid synthase [Pseudoneobacillus rhizosphaerae]|uniref:2-succinyl-5-enolpyruvyl-6-hydroxy-3-cyclohexene-1-carboxylate synthase n=1 Tax=Pseudoneobacillus rhizosphaerae TaxID=2880968 RepID=A0A9C7GBJ0_9BACI|nr:2-succinyl-5-enolpyruvyl-6-hydroxy-3-cyclohexene-1-carboxylic-acid synthase [Pseudoneobacillus rhizosphaerae]CAG9608990.1 2-succinyl-5-enolpyruvyl-6-hydroxy-3-cyclohexene-1-carboxylate synthase [Pseudoneobacillus rhizosphaerae]